MAEEAKVEIEYTDIEVKALEEGWIPPDRFDKADKGKDFKTAEQYMENSSFFKKIGEQKKEIQDLRSTVEGITAHNAKVTKQQLDTQKQQYEQRIETLEEQKIQALDEGDHREVSKIDKEIRKTEKQSADVVEAKPDNSVFTNWVDENEWYQKDNLLMLEADDIGEKLAKAKGLVGKALFDEVSRVVKEKYPAKFENQKRQDAPSVEGGGNSPSSSSKMVSDKDLTPDERQVYNKFDRGGMFKSDKDGSQRKAYIIDVISLRD